MHSCYRYVRFVTRSRRSGFTLVEILVALTLTLILLSSVVFVFAKVGNGMSNAELGIEQSDQARGVTQQLLEDLANATAVPNGRFNHPELGSGYLEIIENGINCPQAVNSTTGQTDLTAGERGDIIMLTCHSTQHPYVGRINGASSSSSTAEIIWFVRGNKLYRRVLLVAPGAASALAGSNPSTFYNNNDVSAHISNGQIVPNSLSDLAKRENRYGHNASVFPFDVRGWGWYGLPTLSECTSGWTSGWTNGSTPPPPPAGQLPTSNIDLWDNTPSGAASMAYSSYAISQQQGSRVAEDVILSNVLEFDVKVYDPSVGGYVDLGSGTRFGNAATQSYLTADYDTFPSNYENDGIYYMNNSGNIQVNTAGGRWSNGFDDDNSNVVDDPSEQLTSPPYSAALRGIQVQIRCFEPNSRQISQATIEQSFVPK